MHQNTVENDSKCALKITKRKNMRFLIKKDNSALILY